jgi:hypothetical protein
MSAWSKVVIPISRQWFRLVIISPQDKFLPQLPQVMVPAINLEKLCRNLAVLDFMNSLCLSIAPNGPPCGFTIRNSMQISDGAGDMSDAGKSLVTAVKIGNKSLKSFIKLGAFPFF